MAASVESLLLVLEASVKRHGAEKPLTVGHLRNIVAMAVKHDIAVDEFAHKAGMEALDDDRRWGSD